MLGAVERHVISSYLTDPSRAPDIVHASEISHNDTCRRQIYYRIIGVPMQLENIDTSFWRERAFDDGHAAHTKWQTWLWDMGKLYGNFECLRCDAFWFARSPQVCVNCGAIRKYLVFREVPVFLDKYNLGGLADGLLEEGILEIKGIGKGTVRIEAPGYYDKFVAGIWTEQELWNEIKRPFPAHMRQAMIYGLGKGVEQVIFIYECKWNQAVKEFTVRVNEELLAPVLDVCLDIKYAVKKQKPIARPNWAAPEVKACTACPYKSECWSEGKTNSVIPVDKPKLKVVRRKASAAA